MYYFQLMAISFNKIYLYSQYEVHNSSFIELHKNQTCYDSNYQISNSCTTYKWVHNLAVIDSEMNVFVCIIPDDDLVIRTIHV